MNSKEHVCFVILLAEGTSGDELTLPEFEGRAKNHDIDHGNLHYHIMITQNLSLDNSHYHYAQLYITITMLNLIERLSNEI